MVSIPNEMNLPEEITQDYYFAAEKGQNYRECCWCVMDTSASEIEFGENGRCNFCSRGEEKIEASRIAARNTTIEQICENVRRRGRDKKYDCVIGLSGGLDSSYVACLAQKHGLRALAVHLDNGWNSELAVSNIQALIEQLGIDLYTHVLDWQEFRDLQRSFFQASVIDIELLTDHAISACLYNEARKWRIPTILYGTNLATECIMPRSWQHRKLDSKNIKSIHASYGRTGANTFQYLSYYRRQWLRSRYAIDHVRVLDFVDYQRDDAASELQKSHGWKPYQEKHGESTFTLFYQNYILPRKFGVDKRRAHLSALIVSRQLSREEAKKKLTEPLIRGDDLRQAFTYVAKKLQFSSDELVAYLQAPPRPHTDFESEFRSYFKYRKLISSAGRLAGVFQRP